MVESATASRPGALQPSVGAVHPPLTKGQQECLVQPSRANDRQVDGDHYKGRAMEPWDIIEAWDLDFFEGSALSYLLRRKPGVARVTDLHKAIHYLEKCIEREQAK